MWTTIKRIEESQFNDSYLAFFDYFGKEVYSIISKRVLDFLKVDRVQIGDKVFITKSFNKDNKPIYLIRKIEVKS